MIQSTDATKFVLLVEDEQSIRDMLVELFDVEGNVALGRLRTQCFDLVVTDLRLGGKRDGGRQVMALAGMLSRSPVDLATIAQHAATAGVRSAFAPARRE